MTRTFAIVGAGLAGATAAATLRAEGFDGRVVLFGEEHYAPYDRPPLSKGYLQGVDDLGKVFVHDDVFYADNNIELRTGTRIDAIDVARRQLRLPEDKTLTYDALLLATGSSPRRPPIPGADLRGVHVLRTLDDSRRLRHAVGGAARVVIIGAGWIGCEVAASARRVTKSVTVVDPLPTPLHRVLGEEVGSVFADLHEDHGVTLRLGVGVAEIVGRDSVEAVLLNDGTRIEADVVVLGVGVTPRVELARAAGLSVNEGVIADERLETTAPGVYVAGDIAEAAHPLLQTHVRVEHWANAKNQGEHAARSMLGANNAYDRLPYFFSDQYDLGMEYVGYAREWDDVVFRGDVPGREFIAFYRQAERVVAAISVNIWDVVDPIKALITSGATPPRRTLVDSSSDLHALAGHHATA